jgi:hypothetical protein
LLFAAYRGNLTIVVELMKAGVAVDNVDAYGNTPMHGAFRSGDEVVIRYMLSRGGNVCLNKRNKKGFRPRDVEMDEKRAHRWIQSLPTLPQISAVDNGSPSRNLYSHFEDPFSPAAEALGILPKVVDNRSLVARQHRDLKKMMHHIGSNASRETWLGPHTSSTRRVNTPARKKMTIRRKRRGLLSGVKRSEANVSKKFKVHGNLRRKLGPHSYAAEALYERMRRIKNREIDARANQRVETPQRKLEELVLTQSAQSRDALGPIFRPFTAIRGLKLFGGNAPPTYRRDERSGNYLPQIPAETPPADAGRLPRGVVGAVRGTVPGTRFHAQPKNYVPQMGSKSAANKETFLQYRNRVEGTQTEEKVDTKAETDRSSERLDKKQWRGHDHVGQKFGFSSLRVGKKRKTST